MYVTADSIIGGYNMGQNKMVQTTLVDMEGMLKNRIHALDITMSTLVKYRPDEAGKVWTQKVCVGYYSI